jgi:hypothetical protein
MRNKSVAAAVVGLLAWGATVAGATVTVTPHEDQPGPAIPARFLGISVETGTIVGAPDGWHKFSPKNAALVNLYRSLGVTDLRVGGNQVDAPEVPIPSATDVDELFAFARAADLKVIYSFRLKTSPQGAEPDAAAEAALARHIVDRYADLLDAFEVGNEPNLYPKTFKLRYDQYYPQWSRLAAAILAAAPGARLAGPGTAGQARSWCPEFARDAKAQFGDRLAYVCQHQYFGGNSKRIKSPTTARANLIGSSIVDGYQSIYDSFVPACRELGLGYRLEETNSLSMGGAMHVSNTLASALWAVRYLHWWADHDCLGINFHTGDWQATKPGEPAGNPYAVYWAMPGHSAYRAEPLAYAMKAFDLGSHGRRLPVTMGPGGGDLAAYAVLGDGGSLHVTLINAGPDAVAVSLPAGGRSNGDAYLLTTANHDLADETGITLGGAAITDDGRWAGRPVKLPPPAGGLFATTVPPASVAVITLTP